MRALFLAALALVGCRVADAAEPGGGPVLVELFTSQGCSSCPAADDLLSELGRRDDLIPLAFHVDYWDRLGWKDPFSSASWTERQGQYARAFDTQTPYTPQLIVNGREEVVGSNRNRVASLITAAAHKPWAGRVTVERVGEGTFKVSSAVAEPLQAKDLVVWVVLYENGETTKVAKGENAGRTLRNDFVVRRMEDVPLGTATVHLELEPEWPAERLGVAAFIQDRDTMKVYGAARVLHIR